jgi:hypothetical protein
MQKPLKLAASLSALSYLVALTALFWRPLRRWS